MQHESQPQTDERGAPSADLVRAVSDALQAGDTASARRLAGDLKAPDLADLIALLEPGQRVALVQVFGTSFNSEVLSELDTAVRDQLTEALPNEVLARAVRDLETDDAAYVIEGLEPGDKAEVLSQLTASDRAAVERNLEYPEDTAGRLMRAEFVAVAPFWTVGQVIDHMREADDLPDTFSEIFVVDPAHRVLGTVELSRLLRTKRHVGIEEIMSRDRHLVLATEDQEEVARQFERYDLMSAPVVDENRRLVGVVTVDDVVEVIEEEAEEDMKRLGGVGDESLADSVLSTARGRIAWLMVNLCTALLSALVIRQFGASIEQMVALAVLMPIVASMGGNAGTQTMTVAVRALATRELSAANTRRIITRELLVGLINGLTVALVLAAIAFLWFGSGKLGVVIAVAIVGNLVVAALGGILVPLTLHRLRFDPAVSSGVFVTTLTDVFGFLAFLGLATLWLL